MHGPNPKVHTLLNYGAFQMYVGDGLEAVARPA
jgi:hypothetical protein